MTQHTERAAEATAQEASPGEAVQDPKAGAQKALPRWAVLALCLCNFAHFYSVCSLFSYAGIMSVDLGWAEDRDQAGFVAGFLGSANTMGRIPTSALWGLLASKIGTSKAMTASMVSVVVGTILFGLCTDLIASILVRGLLFGCGNGFVALFPAIAVELGGEERQTEVFAMVIGAATFIQLFGPAIGGWTYGASERFPAILPNLVGTCLGLNAVVASCRWLPARTPRVTGSSSDKRTTEGGCCSLLCRRPMSFFCLLRLMIGMVNFAFFEVVPLWAISGLELGGLGLSEDDLGVVLSCSAIGAGFFTAKIAPLTAKRLGLRNATCCGIFLAASSLAFLPFVPGEKTLVVLHMFASSGINLIVVTAASLVNNATPPEQRSLVNGIMAAIESFGKGAGPVFSAVAFAWSLVEWGRAGHSLVFLGMTSALLLLLPGVASLPPTVENGQTPENVKKAAYAHADVAEEEKVQSPEIVGVPLDDHVVHPDETHAKRPHSALPVPHYNIKALVTPRLGRRGPGEKEGAKERLMKPGLDSQTVGVEIIETVQEEGAPARVRALSF